MQAGTDRSQSTAEQQKKRKKTLRKKWKRPTIKLATWKVRKLLQKRKTDNVLNEMTRMKLKKLVNSEVRWKRIGEFRKDEFHVADFGNDDYLGGVGIIVHPKLASQVESKSAASDRFIVTGVKNLYQSICITWCYAPTCDKDDAAVDRFCSDNEKVFVMGDLNAQVSNLPEKPSVGLHGLGTRNNKGTNWWTGVR